MMITGGPSHHEIDMVPAAPSATSFEQSTTLAMRPDHVGLEMARFDSEPSLLLTDQHKEQIKQSINGHYVAALAAPSQKKKLFMHAIRVLRGEQIIKHCPEGVRGALRDLTEPALVAAKCEEGIITKLMFPSQSTERAHVHQHAHTMRVLQRIALAYHYRDAAKILRDAFRCEDLAATAGPVARSVSSHDQRLARNLLGNATLALNEPGPTLPPEEMIKSKMTTLLGPQRPQWASELDAHIDTELQRRVTERRMPITTELRSAAKFGANAVLFTGVAVGSGIGGAHVWPRLSPPMWSCTNYESGTPISCSLQAPKTKDVALSLTAGFGVLVPGTIATGATFLTVHSLYEAGRLAWAQRNQLPLELAALSPKRE